MGNLNRTGAHRTELWGLLKVRKRRKKRSTLTFSQSVLEVRVTPSFPVEINAVTDEQSPAHARSYRARLTAHHDSLDPVGF